MKYLAKLVQAERNAKFQRAKVMEKFIFSMTERGKRITQLQLLQDVLYRCLLFIFPVSTFILRDEGLVSGNGAMHAICTIACHERAIAHPDNPV